MLGLSAIIITEATDGPSFCMATAKQGVLSEAATEREFGASDLMWRRDEMLEIKCFMPQEPCFRPSHVPFVLNQGMVLFLHWQ